MRECARVCVYFEGELRGEGVLLLFGGGGGGARVRDSILISWN